MKVYFKRILQDAVVPKKGTEYSVGYDLTAIRVHSKVGNTTFYGTGLQVKTDEGYYTEILPRSSLSKTGYVLANSVGVIDPDYRGELLIALTKVDSSMPDLVVPFTRCQLIVRELCSYDLEEVEELDKTVRNDGGFGSTDKK